MTSGIGGSAIPKDFTWSASLREAGLLLLVALVATGLSWFLRSDSLPLRADPVAYELELTAPLVGIEEALALFEEGDYLFIDTRARVEGEYQTIPGAFLICEDSFDDDLLEYFDFMTTEDTFILFGDGDLFSVSNLATRLQDRDFTNLFILKGGLTAWEKAGGEISLRSGGGS